ncbi:MAG: hypothetical protein M3336_01345, partial [Chloroflexota bacterium]|nr:hypothetical protein [Chloroflexota bacterium]
MELSSFIPLLAGASVFLLVYGLRSANQRSERLARQLGRFANQGRATTLTTAEAGGLFRAGRRLSRVRGLDSFLERKGFAGGLDRQLAAADLPLRVGEYMLIRWLCALGV